MGKKQPTGSALRELADLLEIWANMLREHCDDPANGLPSPFQIDDWLNDYRDEWVRCRSPKKVSIKWGAKGEQAMNEVLAASAKNYLRKSEKRLRDARAAWDGLSRHDTIYARSLARLIKAHAEVCQVWRDILENEEDVEKATGDHAGQAENEHG